MRYLDNISTWLWCSGASFLLYLWNGWPIIESFLPGMNYYCMFRLLIICVHKCSCFWDIYSCRVYRISGLSPQRTYRPSNPELSRGPRDGGQIWGTIASVKIPMTWYSISAMGEGNDLGITLPKEKLICFEAMNQCFGIYKSQLYSANVWNCLA